MAVQQQSLPSFASIISVLSIVFYCVGFIRVELELKEQGKRINALESITEPTKPPSNDPDIKLIKNAPDFKAYILHRNKREADSIKNTTGVKSTGDTMLKINKLLSEGRLQLCQSNGDKCSAGPPGPPGPPGPKGARGRRGQKGRNGNKGDKGIMGSPGRSGKQGIMGVKGLQGRPGTKGMKGEIGPTGMPGTKGEPGESISSPAVVVSPATRTVNESESASFQCSATGNPEPTVEWSKLDNQSEITHSAVSAGKLQLTNLTENDSGVYQCSATSILGQARKVTQLVVNFRPRISLHPGPHYTIEGSNITLPACHVIGHPQPVVTWRKSSGQLPQGRVQDKSSGLQILDVRKADSDTYFCSAVNLLGSDERKALLVVVSLPQFTVKPPVKVEAAPGDTLTLNCSAIGDPQPVISWKRQGAQLPAGRSQVLKDALVIRRLNIADAGSYICVATSAGVFNVESGTYIEMKQSQQRVRLVNGGASYGRVEVYYNGQWGTVCDDLWGTNDANVVCRQLGFSRASSAPANARYGQGSGRIWMDDVNCRGDEASLFQCTHRGWGQASGCSHKEDASVICV